MPEWKEILRERLAALNLEGARENEIIEELTQHLEDRYDDLRAHGTPAEEAQRVALAELSDGERLAKELRKSRYPAVVEPPPERRYLSGFAHDVKIALRMMRKKPAFSLMVAGMLAMGIAGNSAIFSIFNGMFLRPLPFSEPDRLVDLDETAPKWNL